MSPSTLLIAFPERASVAESYQLITACNRAERELGGVELDCSKTTFFGPLGVALIASTLSLRRQAGRSTSLIPPEDEAAAEFLEEVGLERFAKGERIDEGTREVREMRADDRVYTNAVANILGHGVPGFTEDAAYQIELCLNEILQNVFEWSRSSIGCTALARWYHQSRTVQMAVVDRGIGIPAALRQKKIRQLHRRSDAEVIVAAVTTPRLTSRENQVGGLGLKTIKEVVCDRGGTLTVISLGAKVSWKGAKQSSFKSGSLRGTAVVAEFRPDAIVSDPHAYVPVF